MLLLSMKKALFMDRSSFLYYESIKTALFMDD